MNMALARMHSYLLILHLLDGAIKSATSARGAALFPC